MASFENNTITRAGRQVLAHALAYSIPVEFLRIEIGDGESPDQPEEVTQLTNKISDVSISKMSDPKPGVTAIRGAFKANTVMNDFYLREIGVIVKGKDEEEILFAYANAGDKANFIPTGNGSSLVEEVLILSIITGNAKVLFQNIDPNAAATIEDIEDAIDELNVDQIKEDIKQAEKDINEIKKEIEETAEGLVKKAGDKMTGPLEAPEVTSHLKGSADEWNEWKRYDTLTALNTGVGGDMLPPDASISEIISKMNPLTKIVFYYPSVVSSFPAAGILDVQKLSLTSAAASFTGLDGRTWSGYWNNGKWTGWRETVSVPPGIIIPYGGSAGVAAPVGYVFAHGQYLNRTQYSALFAIYGTYYGSSTGTNFRVPDLRGNFIRGLDNGRQVDPDWSWRGLGSEQGDAIRNIWGYAGAGAHNFGYNVDGVSGAYYLGAAYRGNNGAGGNSDYSPIYFDASRVVPVANENRPRNIALNFIIKY